MKDVVSASPPLWTLTCFFQGAVKALVASSKVFKPILTRLQSLMGNIWSCILSILYWLFLLKIKGILLHLCLICKAAQYTGYIYRIRASQLLGVRHRLIKGELEWEIPKLCTEICFIKATTLLRGCNVELQASKCFTCVFNGMFQS